MLKARSDSSHKERAMENCISAKAGGTTIERDKRSCLSESDCHDPSTTGRKGSGPSVGMTTLGGARILSGPLWTRWFAERKETQDPGTGRVFSCKLLVSEKRQRWRWEAEQAEGREPKTQAQNPCLGHPAEADGCGGRGERF